MNDKKIILSICIPTYNRAEKLQQCLNHIVCQFNNESTKNAIEVVVSDNASQDNTIQVVKKFQESFDNIKYFRNEKNLGIDKNIINSVVMANGKYCWHIGDDDFIQNGSLKFLVGFLSKKEIALLTVDSHLFTDTDKSLKEDHGINEKFIIYSNSPEEFYKKGYCQGTLGVFIFQRDLWLKVDRKSYEEFWSYYEIILKMLPSSHLPLAHLNYPLLFMGQDYRWSEGGTAFFTFINAINTYKKLKEFGYSGEFVQNEKDRMSRNLLKTVLSAKSFGLKCSLKNMLLIYKNFKEYPVQLFLTTLVFFLPNNLIKKIKNIRNYLIKKKKR
jgi:abequosyltransferase